MEAFERAALERWGLADDLVPPRYRSQYFAHIWGGGYASGYYAYIWSEVLDQDAFDAFLAEQLNPLALDDTALEARLLGVSRTTKTSGRRSQASRRRRSERSQTLKIRRWATDG